MLNDGGLCTYNAPVRGQKSSSGFERPRMQKIRWGILATGRIAHKMAAALHGVADAELVAVASRSQENADKFGAKWNIGNSYVGYENLAADANVDIVYIATPHALHAQNMKMCLSAGKHVLCEKPLTIHAAEADECIAIARQQGVFLMEAVWMRFFPAIQLLREWIRRDLIGRLHWIQADFLPACTIRSGASNLRSGAWRGRSFGFGHLPHLFNDVSLWFSRFGIGDGPDRNHRR